MRIYKLIMYKNIYKNIYENYTDSIYSSSDNKWFDVCDTNKIDNIIKHIKYYPKFKLSSIKAGIYCAIKNNNPEMISFFYNNYSEYINITNIDASGFFMETIVRKNYDLLIFIYNKYLSLINTSNEYVEEYIKLCSRYNYSQINISNATVNTQIVHFLIKTFNYSNYMHLFLNAINDGNITIIKIALEYDNTLVITKNLSSILYECLDVYNNNELFKILCDHSDLNIDWNEYNFFYLALKKNNFNIIKYIIKKLNKFNSESIYNYYSLRLYESLCIHKNPFREINYITIDKINKYKKLCNFMCTIGLLDEDILLTHKIQLSIL